MMEENQISLDDVSSLLMADALCKGGYMDEVKYIKHTQKKKGELEEKLV